MEEQVKSWLDEQRSIVLKLEDLLAKQADDHIAYARESTQRMHELNVAMSNYMAMQKTQLDEYVKHLDGAVRSRKQAQANVTKLMDALRAEQEKNKILLDIISHITANPTASVQVGTIIPGAQKARN